MLYHLSGHLQKQPKGKHKLNKVGRGREPQGAGVCGGLNPPQREWPENQARAPQDVGGVAVGGTSHTRYSESIRDIWALASPLSSRVTVAQSLVGSRQVCCEAVWGTGGGAACPRPNPAPVPPPQGVFGEKPSLPEYKVAAIRKSPFILLHYGALRATWDGFILLATLYVAVTVPYSVCVSTAREPSAARSPPSVCDLAVEVLFILGMWLCAHPLGARTQDLPCPGVCDLWV